MVEVVAGLGYKVGVFLKGLGLLWHNAGQGPRAGEFQMGKAQRCGELLQLLVISESVTVGDVQNISIKVSLTHRRKMKTNAYRHILMHPTQSQRWHRPRRFRQ